MNRTVLRVRYGADILVILSSTSAAVVHLQKKKMFSVLLLHSFPLFGLNDTSHCSKDIQKTAT